MNKRCYRIIFNKHRPQLMAVAENTVGQGKDGSSDSAVVNTRAIDWVPNWLCKTLAAITMMSLGSAAFAADIIAAPNAGAGKQPGVIAAPNGVTVVNIAAPTSSGVSHNQYQQFNVGSGGAILNNSAQLTSTQLGGYVNGNANLTPGNAARLLLNEVIAPNPSQLRGMLEVAGQKAEVIIANPWGISVGAGAGFINTSNATLTTGIPQLSNGNLTGYRVTGGSIGIDGQADVSTLDSFTIISRALQVNAGLYAKQMNVVLGANQVDKATLNATSIKGDGSAPALALDVAQLGGMYAGVITLIGTEAGVGVNSRGQIQATGGTLQLTSAGDLVLSGSTRSKGDMTLQADGTLNNGGTTSAAGNLNANANHAQLDGTLAAGQNLIVAAADVSGNGGLAAGSREDGSIAEQGNLQITASNTLQHAGKLLAAQQILLDGATVQLDGAVANSLHGDINASSAEDLGLNGAKVTAAGRVDFQAKGRVNTSGGIIAGNSLHIQAQALSNQQGTLAQAGNGTLALNITDSLDNSKGQIVSDGQMVLAVDRLSNAAGLIQADQLTVNAGSLNNQGGEILALGANPLNSLHVSGAMDNSRAGRIQSNGSWQIDASSLSNQQGTLQAQQALTVAVTGDVDNRNGRLSSGSELTLGAANINNQQGLMQSTGGLSVTALGVLDNSTGKLLSNQAMTLRSQQLLNQQGLVSGGGAMALTMSSLSNQRGQLVGGQTMTLSLVDDFTFGQGDTLSSRGLLQLTNAGDIFNTGAWQSGGDLVLNARNLSNGLGAQLSAGGALAANVSGNLNNQGRLDGTQVQLQADVLDNAGMISGDRVSANARVIQNHGGAAVLAATRQLDADAIERMSNTGGALIYSAGGMNLHSAGLIENVSSFIAAEGDLGVVANRLENRRSEVVIAREAESSINYSWNKYNYYWRSFGAYGRGDLSAVTQTLPFNNPDAAYSDYGTILQVDAANKKALVRYQGTHEIWVNYNALKKNSDGSYDMTFYEGKACLGMGEACPYQQVVWREYTGVPRVEQWDPNLHVNPIELDDIEDLYNFRERSVSSTRYMDKLISAGAAATLDGGGRMHLAVGSLLNDASRITANGDLSIVGASSVVNQSYSINERLHETRVDHYDKHVGVHWYRSWTRDETTTIQTLDAMIAGNQGVSIAAPTIANVTQSLAQTAAVQPGTGAAGRAIPSDALSNLLAQLPNNGLFKQTTFPGTHFLIETDPRFTQYGNFISSDYLLQQLGFDPNVIQKRLGDGYYEQKLVKDQMLALTGAASRNGQDATEQYKQLLNSGVKVAQSFQLTLGVALSPEQVARLQEDIVWMVSETVQTANGPQQVLVPKVYLASGSPSLVADGAVIRGKSLDLQGGVLNNQGQLHGDENLTVKAEQLNHNGGLIDAKNVSLSAKQITLSTDLQHSGRTAEVRGAEVSLSGEDVTLRGAKISGSDSVSLSASNNLTITTARRQEDGTVQVMAGRMGNRDTSQQEPGGSGIATYSGHWERAQGSDISSGGKLALSAGQDLTVQGSSAKAQGATVLSAGRDINIVTDTTHDSGILTADSVGTQVSARHQSDAVYTSQVGGDGGLTIVAGQQLNVSGSALSSDKSSIVLAADKVTIQEARRQSSDQDQEQGDDNWGQTLIGKSQSISSSVAGAKDVSIVARSSDIAVQGSSIDSAQGAIKLKAAQDVKLLASEDIDSLQQERHSTSEGFLSSTKTDTYLDHQRSTAQGSSLSGQTVDLAAGRDLTVRGSRVSATNALTLNAARDIVIDSAQETRREAQTSQTVTESNWLGKALVAASTFSALTTGGISLFGDGVVTATLLTHKDGQGALLDGTTTQRGSTLSAGSLSSHSGRDTQVIGSTLVADKTVDLSAGRDLSIVSAQNTANNQSSSSSKTSGFVGSWWQPAFGTVKQSQTADSAATTQVASQVASLGGDVKISAADHYTQTASDVLALQGNIAITAKTIDVTAALDRQTAEQAQQYQKTAIGGNVSVPLINAAMAMANVAKASSQTSDPRMQALAAATLAMQAKGAMDSAQALMANGGSATGIKVSVSLGSSKTESNSQQAVDTVVGSTVAAGGDVTLTATGGGTASDLTVQGSNVQAGNNVNLTADHAINLLAAADNATQTSSNGGSSSSVGVGFSFGGSQNGFTLELGANRSRGNADGTDVFWTNTQVAAGNTLAFKSGADTVLKGAVASAPQVIADVGGNLVMESLQDTSTFDAKQQSAGFGLSLCIPPFCYGASTGSVSAGGSKIQSDYASVSQQTAIKAGDGGFQVAVKGDTTLTGAAIASTDQAVQNGKNSFTTGGTLTLSDIKNRADYNADAYNITLSGSTKFGDQTSKEAQSKMTEADKAAAASKTSGLSPSALSGAGTGKDSGSAGSTTQAGISGIAGNTAMRTGDKETGIAKIFDADKVQREIQAQTQITQAFNQVAPKAAADYANGRVEEIKRQIDLEHDPEKKAALVAEAKKWAPNGSYNIAMNIIIGAAGGNLESSVSKEMLSWAANEMRQNMIADSKQFKGLCVTPTDCISNQSGQSVGVNGDEFKLAGGRIVIETWCSKGGTGACMTDATTKSGYAENSDGTVMFRPTDDSGKVLTINEFVGQHPEIRSELGGVQGGKGQFELFGMQFDYNKGSLWDKLAEGYAGIHDTFNSIIWYDKLGNGRNLNGTLVETVGNVANTTNVVLATPFALSVLLPTEVWDAISSGIRSIK